MKHVLLALVGLLPAAAAQAASVTVVVENVESTKGDVKVALCDRDLSPEGCSAFIATPATVGSVSVTFQDVPPGKWAVAAFQDENKSGDMDTFLKVPREPYALSNNASEQVVPKLKDALIPISDGDNQIRVKLGRFMSH